MKQYAVTPQRIFLLFLPVALASLTLFAVFNRRHHCPHDNPLCRRKRPVYRLLS